MIQHNYIIQILCLLIPVSSFSILNNNFPSWVTGNVLIVLWEPSRVMGWSSCLHTELVWSDLSIAKLFSFSDVVFTVHSSQRSILASRMYFFRTVSLQIFTLLSFPLESKKLFSYFFLVLLLTYLVQSAKLQSLLANICNWYMQNLGLWIKSNFGHLFLIWLNKDVCTSLCYCPCKPANNIFLCK